VRQVGKRGLPGCSTAHSSTAVVRAGAGVRGLPGVPGVRVQDGGCLRWGLVLGMNSWHGVAADMRVMIRSARQQAQCARKHHVHAGHPHAMQATP
jgi:hypothetical protein